MVIKEEQVLLGDRWSHSAKTQTSADKQQTEDGNSPDTGHELKAHNGEHSGENK